MKKHPVDDLFKRKLADLDKKPSSEAWLKIQERAKSQRRAVGWVWYAAAGIAVTLMAGYLVWQNDLTNQVEFGGNPKVSVVTPKAKPSLPVVEEQPDKVAVKEQPASGHEPAGQPERPQIAVRKETDRSVKEAKKANPVEKPAMEQAIAINEKQITDIKPVPAEPIVHSTIQEIKTLSDEPAVSRVNKVETEPTRIVMVAVETNASEMDEKPKSSRFSRVFRQLKNARAGEKVDWDEVGFNPKNLVARVDDRLRNKEEKTSEKDHPKEKTKL
ncbi:hypothetical protein [Dyadobacter sp. MSC1_007]|jgi:hypothetical protein|uniref:hypothetical protein n=1 Tax=Dyadobacter sp. MSC1_007 TaxID=2909264 RepID=UPI00202FA027|nr:hypothetical protein [Dyadobacter sp. MSC1_007]